MKTKKKLIFYITISIAFSFIGLSNINAEEITPATCFDKISNGDQITITNYVRTRAGCPNYKINIPATINDKSVTRIGVRAFYNKDLSSIILPNTITSIGKLAFANNNIANLSLGEKIISIGEGAFNNNPLIPEQGQNAKYIYERTDTNSDGIAEINTEKVISIGKCASGNNITLPNTIKTIGTFAFYNIIVNQLTIPEGVTTIEPKGLVGSGINTLKIPNSLTTADINLDIKEFPYLEEKAVYQKWLIYNEETQSYIPYTFTSGSATIKNSYLNQSYLYYLDAYSISHNTIKIEWEHNGSSSTTIALEKYNTSTREYELYKEINNNKGITITGLTTNETYKFRATVYVTDPDGIKHYLEINNKKQYLYISVTPKLNTPSNFKAIKYKSKIAKLSWSKVSGATGYSIYKYNTKTKKYYLLKNTTSSVHYTSYENKAGYGYYYKIRAYKVVNGKKIYSNYTSSKYVRV